MPQLLHNINKLSFIESRRMKNITVVPGSGVMLNYWLDFHPLPLVGLARCEVSSKVVDKSKLFTTTLTAHLSEHFDVRGRHLSFLASCVNGDRFLIGINEAPYPVANTSDIMPDKETDRSGCSLSVEYTDTLGILPVLDWCRVFF